LRHNGGHIRMKNEVLIAIFLPADPQQILF